MKNTNHDKEHIAFSRRNFLSTVGLAGAGSILMGGINITALASSPLASILNSAETDRILVLIRLVGGNDGLNTIIPINQYSNYANQRPNIRIPENKVITLEEEFGMPDTMQVLSNFWDEGKMSVIHSVGYPNQDLSHFRSTDIWDSASDSQTIDQTGWLGRYIANEYPDFLINPPSVPPAVQIGNSNMFTAQIGEGLSNLGFSVANPEQMVAIAENGSLYDINDVPDCYYGDQLRFLRTVTNSNYTFSEAINNAYQNSTNNATYSNNQLSEQLALVARLIKGNLGTKIYMVTLNGFDTHDSQNDLHPILMNNLSNAVSEFYQDLESANWDNKVLSMSFSEFGRRIEENASFGTDHGAAAPVLLFGGGLENHNQQSYGELADLNNPDNNGNLQFNVDFRSVYATLLENWLCVPSEVVDGILNDNFSRIDNLIPNCSEVTSANALISQNIEAEISHFVTMQGSQSVLTIENNKAQKIIIEVYDISARKITELFNGFLNVGKHSFNFSPRLVGLSVGAYIYSIKTNNAKVGGKLMNFQL